MATTSALKSLRDRLDSPTRANTFTLAGQNIDFCFSAYILHHKNIVHKRKVGFNRVREILYGLEPNIAPYQFDEEFNSDLMFYLIESKENGGIGLKPLSAEEYMRIIIAVLTWAGKHGAELSDSYEKIPNIPYEPHRICPTMAEICHIYFFDLNAVKMRSDHRTTLEKVRDTYVLNAVCYGLRYSDLKRIDKSCFKGDQLTIVQQKTGRVVKNDGTMVLYEQIKRELLAKYPNMESPYRGNISNFDKYIKELLSMMGGSFDKIEVIEYRCGNHLYHEEKPRWKCFASHSARRGYITNNLRVRKQDLTDIQHAVGHKSSSMTENYIVLDNE